MKIERHVKRVALAVGVAIILVGGSAAVGERLSTFKAVAITRVSEIREIERAANGRLLAIGRLDRISASEFAVSVLGQNFALTGGQANTQFVEHAQVGRPVALFGDIDGANYLVDAAIVLDGQYVQGASKVFLRGSFSSVNRKLSVISIGPQLLDASSVVQQRSISKLGKDSIAAIVGSQPAIEGKVLVEKIGLARRSARPDASVGTGRNASVGTGRDASVGTGSTSN